MFGVSGSGSHVRGVDGSNPGAALVYPVLSNWTDPSLWISSVIRPVYTMHVVITAWISIFTLIQPKSTENRGDVGHVCPRLALLT